jgi:hypothetical protein
MYLPPGSPELAQAAQALATRDHLKGLRDTNFHLLVACTFAVGVGLLMELPEIVHDMCEIYGRKSRELKYWLTPSVERREYPKRDWVKKWAALGWVLIVLGVMGEGWFETQVSKYDSALSNMTDAVVAKAQEESAHAEAIAKGFDAQIAQSDAAAKSAEATAESERLARVQLEKQIQPRSLDDTARSAIGKELERFSPSLSGRKVKVSSYTADAEGVVFSLEIIDALMKAHIDSDPVVGRLMPVGLVDMGVKITGPVSDEGFIRALATDIHSYADTVVFAEWNPKYKDLEVLVAAKPVSGLPNVTTQATQPSSASH